MTRIPSTVSVASLDTHRLIIAVPNEGPADVASNLPRPVAASVLRQLADSLDGSAPAPFVPRTERSYWQAIADALNAANAVGMPVGIDLDGTLTDHNAHSVVWNFEAERWDVAGYDDAPEGTKEAPAAEQPTHGTEVAEDAARRFARRLRAVELLCSGRPGYHAITVKALLTAMGEADEEGQEPPLLDPFTEAAVRRGALLGGADAIEALPQDHECDPGRGDAVKLLRRLAGLTSTTEQPTGLTWEARADHAVRLYATTAIELEDARRDTGRLRNRLAKLERSAAELAALDAHGVDNWDGYDEAIASLPQNTATELEQGQADADHLAVPKVGDRYEKRAAPDAGRIVTVSRVWVAGSGRTSVAYDWRDDKPGQAGSACPIDLFHRKYEAVAEQPLAFPQLAVPCPQCDAPARQLCTSHSGTRQRTNDTHQARTRAYRATQAGR
ncbi:hypothetical protein [Streptomyces sp. NPDC017520]|uniref:zinc finger domain-containing protein n=1 Tax=Streptomyces sp. NPDC017520 TaxID=3364998 RepID=UPI003795AD99